MPAAGAAAMNPWAMAAIAGSNAIGKAAAPAPAISGGGPNYNRVNIGAPTFTTRASAASAGQAFADQLPTMAALGVVGLVAWTVLK